VTGLALAGASVTVNTAFVVPAFPSLTVASPIDRAGGPSSSTMVPTPRASEIVALTGAERFTKNVSLFSSVASSSTATVTVALVWPGVKVSVPLVAV